MNDESFDDFLQEATLEVSELWEQAGGVELTPTERQQLNDLLTGFFYDKRD